MPRWNPPREFDGFVIRGLLGRGGMGRVYLAYETSLDRPVALKLIAADNPDVSARKRFAREARAIARLQHANIGAIYRIGDVEGRPYIAYEYVDGESLDKVPTPIPWTRAIEIGLAVARGLAVAHQRGVLHRDVKPGNVILAKDGGIKLVDFGLAKLLVEASYEPHGSGPPAAWDEAMGTADTARLGSGIRAGLSDAGLAWGCGTQTGAMLGTPNYVAPEVWRGERATARSDVYALGLVLYEICSGTLPFAGLTGRALMDRVTAGALPPLATVHPDLPRSFAAVVDRAAAHEPADRHADGAELAGDLETVESVLGGFRMVGVRRGGQDDVSLVAASLSRIQPNADALMTAFYDDLLARTPQLRPLLPGSLVDQQMMLAAALRLAVDSLGRPDELVPVLEDLGRRHASHGISPRHLALFGDALLDTARRFDHEAWSSSTEAAWRRAFASISDAMLRGMMLPELRKRA